MIREEITTLSPEETLQIGASFYSELALPSVIAFFGDLGAGKTTFIRGIASRAGVDKREICSPTFTYLNIYEGRIKIYHFDLYRLPNEREFLAAGFDEYLYSDGICCIEWSEKIPSLLKNLNVASLSSFYRVSIASINEDTRKIIIE